MMRTGQGWIIGLLAAVALAVAEYAVATHALAAAVVYGLIVAFGVGIVSRYCGFRSGGGGWRWVDSVVGLVGFGEREVMTGRDALITGAVLVAMLAFPQPWLLGDSDLMFMFWAPVVAGSILMGQRVCPTCDNAVCPFRRRQKV